MKVSIITLCWNHLEDVTKPFIPEILKTQEVDYELIFIDNGSEDGTYDYLYKKFWSLPNIKVVKLKENQRWNGGNNEGYKYATGDYICYINNDVIIHDPLWLKKLLDHAEANPNKILGAEMVDWQPASEWNGVKTPYLNGWLLFNHREFNEKFGVMHQAFNTPYLEDVEYCVRARHYGWDWEKIDLHIEHLGARSSYDQIDMWGNANASRETFIKLMEKLDTNPTIGEYLDFRVK